MTVAFQESPERVSTAMVRSARSVGRVRVSPWKRAPQPPPFSLAGVHPGMGSGGRSLGRSGRLIRVRGSGTELAVEGLVDEGAQPGADVEVPLGAEALEALTGFGRDADMKRYTVQHTNTQRHIEQQSDYSAPWKGAFFRRVRTPPNNCRSGW